MRPKDARKSGCWVNVAALTAGLVLGASGRYDEFVFRTIRGRLVNVMAFGPGDPIVIAHGGFTGNYELWLPPIELLSRRWRCVTFDHRGAGENLSGPISRDELIADLFALMDDLGMDRAVVAAESMGVGIVLAAALEKPERFSALVLVDGAPAFTQERTSALAAGLRGQFGPTLESFVSRGIPEPEHDHVRRWGMHILTRSTPELSAELIECMWGLDLTERLAELEVPVLILHGEEDRIIPFSVAQEMAARLPQSRLVLLEGKGHAPTLTAPERVADEMAKFLTDVI